MHRFATRQKVTMDEQTIEQGLQRKRRKVDEKEKELRLLRSTIWSVNEIKNCDSKWADHAWNFRISNFHDELRITNTHGTVLKESLTIEEIITASGDLWKKLKSHFYIYDTLINPHKTILKGLNANVDLLYRLNDEIRIGNSIGGDVRTVMNEDFQFPIVDGTPVCFISLDHMQHAASICEFYGLVADNPEATLLQFLGVRSSMPINYGIRGRTLKEYRDNSTLIDAEDIIRLPVPVSKLPDDFPRHDTPRRVHELSVQQLKDLLKAYDLKFLPNNLRSTLEILFFRECGLKHFAFFPAYLSSE